MRANRPSVLVLVLSLLAVPLASAKTVTVDTTVDDASLGACDDATPNDCSLRGAVTAANAANEHWDIVLPSGTYVMRTSTPCAFVSAIFGDTGFTGTSLCILRDVSIKGAGAGTTTIDGNASDRAISISANATVTLSGLTITNGRQTGGNIIGGGGGFLNHGHAAVTDAVITNNTADIGGGGLDNKGTLSLLRTTVTRNNAPGQGGGINNQHSGSFGTSSSGTLTVTDSLVTANVAGQGAGIVNDYSTVTLLRSTVSLNNATGNGGGITNFAYGVVNIVDSTVSGNTAVNNAGIDTGGSSPAASCAVNLRNATITGNQASRSNGGLVNAQYQTVTMANSVLAGNTGGFAPDCAAEVQSLGYNLIGDTTNCGIVGNTSGNRTGDPQLAPLTDNGGPTPTHAPLSGSPLIDAGNPAGCVDADGTPLSVDQRGASRTVDGDGDGNARCDIGAVEAGSGFAIASITPREGGNAGTVTMTLRGNGFAPGAAVTLARTGQPDVPAQTVQVRAGGNVAVARFALAGVATGAWDVVLTNPDATSARRNGAFTVAEARAADLYVDVAGPETIRAGFPVRYLVFYGNRGNVDALAVPVELHVTDSVISQPRFAIAQPPIQPERQIQDGSGWERTYRVLRTYSNPGDRAFKLIVPVVPPGYRGVLEFAVQGPIENIGKPVAMIAQVGAPLVENGTLRPEMRDIFAAGAHDVAQRVWEYTIPTGLDADMKDYIRVQYELVVAAGLDAYVQSFGTSQAIFSETQLVYDLSVFGLAWSLFPPDAPGPAPRSPLAQPHCVIFYPRGGQAPVCPDVCSCHSAAYDPKPADDCVGEGALLKDGCAKPGDDKSCFAMGGVVESHDGQPFCTNSPGCIPGPTCVRTPITSKLAHDPNEKSGPAGGGAVHAIRIDAPFSYSVRFENQPTATAPAATVEITDHLDPARFDLATFALGPMAFGTHRVLPPDGLTDYTEDVDLRPAQDLIVRVEGSLDAANANVAWRFTSLDPATMQPVTGADQGFLPPNTNPPAGDGLVSFTVATLPDLASGTSVENMARIVFDANPPIDTPVWSNLVDMTAPVSGVPGAATNACSQDVAVQWSGSDVGSAIDEFALEVSEDGGPFAPWLRPDGSASAATYTGRWGHAYAFRSTAIDLAGNVSATSAPSTPAKVATCGPYDLGVVTVLTPPVVTLDADHPAQTTPVAVVIRNRGRSTQVIPDAATLARLVTLRARSLGTCPDARVALNGGPHQLSLPFRLAPGGKAYALFDVVIECVRDAAQGRGHEDFSLAARVAQDALGGVDGNPADDTCPRAPARTMRFGRPSVEAGCGSATPARPTGGPLLIDVVR